MSSHLNNAAMCNEDQVTIRTGEVPALLKKYEDSLLPSRPPPTPVLMKEAFATNFPEQLALKLRGDILHSVLFGLAGAGKSTVSNFINYVLYGKKFAGGHQTGDAAVAGGQFSTQCVREKASFYLLEWDVKQKGDLLLTDTVGFKGDESELLAIGNGKLKEIEAWPRDNSEASNFKRVEITNRPPQTARPTCFVLFISADQLMNRNDKANDAIVNSVLEAAKTKFRAGEFQVEIPIMIVISKVDLMESNPTKEDLLLQRTSPKLNGIFKACHERFGVAQDDIFALGFMDKTDVSDFSSTTKDPRVLTIRHLLLKIAEGAQICAKKFKLLEQSPKQTELKNENKNNNDDDEQKQLAAAAAAYGCANPNADADGTWSEGIPSDSDEHNVADVMVETLVAQANQKRESVRAKELEVQMKLFTSRKSFVTSLGQNDLRIFLEHCNNVPHSVTHAISEGGYTGAEFAEDSFVASTFDSVSLVRYAITQHQLQSFVTQRSSLLDQLSAPAENLLRQLKEHLPSIDCVHPHEVVIDKRSKLGQGGFGIVYKATVSSQANRPCAAKIFTDYNVAMQEIRHMPLLRHPNILAVVGVTVDDSSNPSVVLLTELADGDLASLLSATPKLALGTIYNFALQLAVGLETLHSSSPRIIHCDIKLANILVVNSVNGPTLKIADFGFVHETDVTATSERSIFAATDRYLPPEIHVDRRRYQRDSKNKIKISPTVDVFALGIILLQMIAPVWYKLAGCEQIQKMVVQVLEKEELLTSDSECCVSNLQSEVGDCDELIQLVKDCLMVNRKKRPRNGRECLQRLSLISKNERNDSNYSSDDEGSESHSVIDDTDDYDHHHGGGGGGGNSGNGGAGDRDDDDDGDGDEDEQEGNNEGDYGGEDEEETEEEQEDAEENENPAETTEEPATQLPSNPRLSSSKDDSPSSNEQNKQNNCSTNSTEQPQTDLQQQLMMMRMMMTMMMSQQQQPAVHHHVYHVHHYHHYDAPAPPEFDPESVSNTFGDNDDRNGNDDDSSVGDTASSSDGQLPFGSQRGMEPSQLNAANQLNAPNLVTIPVTSQVRLAVNYSAANSAVNSNSGNFFRSSAPSRMAGATLRQMQSSIARSNHIVGQQQQQQQQQQTNTSTTTEPGAPFHPVVDQPLQQTNPTYQDIWQMYQNRQ